MTNLKSLLLTFLLLISFLSKAQELTVPEKIRFADLELTLNNQARKEIQADVDALTRSEKYFQIKLDRVNLYMPLIEKIIAEEGLPNDFKYLVIQESALISDAVSTSNAVGFWQFKEATAVEVGMRVDRTIDDRKNIEKSTRGAATYLKKNNQYFNNWFCALISYQAGLGGAKGILGDRYNGKKEVAIDQNTYWYFKKFLAHKIAFEAHIGKPTSDNTQLAIHKPAANQRISEIANDIKVDENTLKEYNKWLQTDVFPAGDYAIYYPTQNHSLAENITPEVTTQNITTTPASKPIRSNTNTRKSTPATTTEATIELTQDTDASGNVYTLMEVIDQSIEFPRISGDTLASRKAGWITVNGLQGIMAARGGTVFSMATDARMPEAKFRKLNDMTRNQRQEVGKYYYTEKKRREGLVPYHIVKPGDKLWEISQKYGITLSALKSKNRIYNDNNLQVGMILYLQRTRSPREAIAYDAYWLERSGKKLTKSTVAETSETPKATISIQSNSQEAEKVIIESEPASAPLSAVRMVEHKVVVGETLFALAKKYGVSVADIQKANNFTAQSTLSIGQVIQIPTTGEYLYHKVAAGESIFDIARKYTVTVSDLKAWNLKSENDLQQGEILKIRANRIK
ncbi:LysM peptidoglycan-binding domain-containing protein [Penaeicola halotolerans]|uniref:LysM peptidoglycan-binding domain-containing protein n=1 Tax=Penaeicola halotolerans TaxID=2793196 RepID=UPI001CF8A8DD|nr:LysM peptidoglycan-binding domain-containing protein [Penaeicola halotolerans]